MAVPGTKGHLQLLYWTGWRADAHNPSPKGQGIAGWFIFKTSLCLCSSSCEEERQTPSSRMTPGVRTSHPCSWSGAGVSYTEGRANCPVRFPSREMRNEWVLSQELATLSPLRRLPRRNFRPSLLCVYLRIHGILFKKYSKLSQRCFVIPQACRVSNKEILT